MKIFVTGATGFVGSAVVRELIAAGHTVRGLSRSDEKAQQLIGVGAEALRGDLTDTASLRAGATGMDAVVHLAFNHDDLSKMAESAQDERAAIAAMGAELEPGKLLVVTSATGLVHSDPGCLRLEQDPPMSAWPRNPEAAAREVAERGVHVSAVRLPQVHDTEKQGLVTFMIALARGKGVSAYVGDGVNRWAAAPVADTAALYRKIIEKPTPGVSIYHAVQEEGISMREIAETVGAGLSIPVVSIHPDKASEHFGWMGHFISLDMPASSQWTREAMDWNPTGPGLIDDLSRMKYQ